MENTSFLLIDESVLPEVYQKVIRVNKPGVLVNLLTVFYKANANILTINQNIPVKGKAFVSVSARSENMSIEIDELLKRLFEVQGVIKIDSIVG